MCDRFTIIAIVYNNVKYDFLECPTCIRGEGVVEYLMLLVFFELLEVRLSECFKNSFNGFTYY